MASSKRKEADRIKTQLMILAVMLVLVLIVNRQKILTALGMSGTKKGPGSATPAGQANAGATLPTGPGGAPQIPTGGGASPLEPAQTPFDIPALSPEVIAKLKARASNKPIVEEDVTPREIERTINPFTSFKADAELHVSEGGEAGPVVKDLRRSPGPRSPGQPQSDRSLRVQQTLATYRSYGVMTLDGERQAIIKREGNVVPYHLRSGEPLEGIEFNLRVHLTADNRVWIEDGEANEAERFYELGTGKPKPVGPAVPVVVPPKTAGQSRSSGEPIGVFLDETFE
jgi:hypothetical protein